MKNILIIGLGKFGQHLAHKLQKLGDEICVVDIKPENVDLISSKIPNAYVADCTKIEALRDLGVHHYDTCVVAIGDNFQASLEITALLKELKAKKIIAKATTYIQEKFLKMAGADEIVYPEKDCAEKLALRCDATKILDFINVGNSYGIYEIATPKSWWNHSLKDLDVRNKYKINVVAIKSENNDVVLPDADYIFKETDITIVMSTEHDIMKLTK